MQCQSLDRNEEISLLLDSSDESHQGFPVVLQPRSEERDEMRLTDGQARLLSLALQARYGIEGLFDADLQALLLEQAQKQEMDVRALVNIGLRAASKMFTDLGVKYAQNDVSRAWNESILEEGNI